MDHRAVRLALEAALAAWPRLTFPPQHERVAEYARLPSLVGAYWGLTGGLADLPCSQRAYAEFVADAAAAADVRAPRVGVIARGLLKYPSFVRQHHMELMLRERFTHVVSGEELDHKGYDFLVIEQGLACGLGLGMDTANARCWEQAKARRNPPPLNLPVLHLRIDLNGGYRVGPFTLFDERDVDHFESWMAHQRETLLARVTP